MKHIVLVGLPGSGKTSVGRALATHLRLPFHDFDEEIERFTGVSIAEFFRSHGEAAFRRREFQLSQELAANPHTIVVAPGGGWMTQPAAVALVRPRAVLVYLRVSPEAAGGRLAGSTGQRPLLAGPDPLGALRRLDAERRPLYETADITVDAEDVDIKELTLRIAGALAQIQKSGG
ncbi:MAG: shikimate kinase [Gemmatimonadaceae bacterium]